MVKIVNIHIPKTTETSFRKPLEESYNNTLHDYGNKINRDLNEIDFVLLEEIKNTIVKTMIYIIKF